MRTLPGRFAVGFVGKMRWGSDFLCKVKAGVTEKVRGVVSRKAVEGGLVLGGGRHTERGMRKVLLLKSRVAGAIF